MLIFKSKYLPTHLSNMKCPLSIQVQLLSSPSADTKFVLSVLIFLNTLKNEILLHKLAHLRLLKIVRTRHCMLQLAWHLNKRIQRERRLDEYSFQCSVQSPWARMYAAKAVGCLKQKETTICQKCKFCITPITVVEGGVRGQWWCSTLGKQVKYNQIFFQKK